LVFLRCDTYRLPVRRPRCRVPSQIIAYFHFFRSPYTILYYYLKNY
jgi:hypothetical protein